MDYTDPVKVLGTIIGTTLPDDEKTKLRVIDGKVPEKPGKLVEDINFSGLGIEDFLELDDGVVGLAGRVNTTQTAEECEYVWPIASA